MATYNANIIQVSEKQRGNPLLRFVRLCQWEYNKDIIPDYVMGTTCVVFISLKFHLLHPKHVENRIREVGKMFKLRVVLALLDDDNVTTLLNLNRICFASEFTLIVAASNEECGRYIETLKSFENKSTASIQEKVESEFVPKLNQVLTSVKSVNKSDVQTLLDVFGSLENICSASEQQLVLCPGLGEKKVKRLYSALHAPFSGSKKYRKVVDIEQAYNISIRDIDGIEPRTTAAVTAVDADVSVAGPITTTSESSVNTEISPAVFSNHDSASATEELFPEVIPLENPNIAPDVSHDIAEYSAYFD